MTYFSSIFYSARNWLIICAAGFFLISKLGTYWIDNGEGYEKGNRRRFVVVLKMECIMLLCNLFMYNQLMAYFDKKELSKYDEWTKNRHRASVALIIFMVSSQMVYFLYFAPDAIQLIFFDICALLFGAWTNLLGLVAGFSLLGIFVYVLDAISGAWPIVARISEIPCVNSLILDRRCQIRVTLATTAVMSFIMWYSSDKIVVKEINVPIKNFSGNGGTVRLALVSDLHVGATVYKKQVTRVVDTLLELDVDVVTLVGDIVDGPAERLADRLMPMWPLRDRFMCFFVTGNHEYYYGDAMKWFTVYEDLGIHVLSNKAEMFRNICIVGVNDISSNYSGIKNHGMNLSEAVHNCTNGTTRILLAHNPASVLTFPKNNLEEIDVILSGHTHAGQYYVLVPMVFWMLPYYHGLYDLEHGKLLVSAGTLYQGAPMKMLQMSEIWVVNLMRQES